MPSHAEHLQEFAKSKKLLRVRDLDALGIPRRVLTELHNAGKLERIARGVYRLPSMAVSENHSLAEASIRVPSGVISLLSALRFYGLTIQNQ
jgi:predicted transcriptional regulator of viral defense system